MHYVFLLSDFWIRILLKSTKNAKKHYCITYFIDGVKCHRNSMRKIKCETP
uniref:Uncharacterized protein n=1 Tax=Escherichia coli TaxID=562 RepID=A0A7T8KTR6_ECOLX|nr:hypothetical protein [Escherichia coli]